jgi:hypothetical protein
MQGEVPTATRAGTSIQQQGYPEDLSPGQSISCQPQMEDFSTRSTCGSLASLFTRVLFLATYRIRGRGRNFLSVVVHLTVLIFSLLLLAGPVCAQGTPRVLPLDDTPKSPLPRPSAGQITGKRGEPELDNPTTRLLWQRGEMGIPSPAHKSHLLREAMRHAKGRFGVSGGGTPISRTDIIVGANSSFRQWSTLAGAGAYGRGNFSRSKMNAD